MSSALNIALAGLILGLAAWSVLTRETLAAVIGFVAYGLLLTLVWVQLQGIDVALTEAAIGGGLTGILLFGAAVRLRGSATTPEAEPTPARVRWLAASVSAAVSAGLIICVFSLPEPAPTLAPAVAANIAVTEVGNPITAVLLAFRAMDTLLEAIVLVFALIGVWSLAADRAWGGRPGSQPVKDPNGMLTYAARILPPLGLMIGAYIFWVGADYPGGKFQGATLLAAMWLLILLAGLTDAPRIDRPAIRIGLVLGPVAFIAIGLAGVLTAGSFLAYPDGFAKPLIVTIELALLPSLTLVLGLLLLGTPDRSDEQ
jgi:multisubunit Na+/H+ antiporter MnhB subunit